MTVVGGEDDERVVGQAEPAEPVEDLAPLGADERHHSIVEGHVLPEIVLRVEMGGTAMRRERLMPAAENRVCLLNPGQIKCGAVFSWSCGVTRPGCMWSGSHIKAQGSGTVKGGGGSWNEAQRKNGLPAAASMKAAERSPAQRV